MGWLPILGILNVWLLIEELTGAPLLFTRSAVMIAIHLGAGAMINEPLCFGA